MKRSLKAKYHLLIGILLAIILLQALFILLSANQARDLEVLVSDIQTITIIFVFVIFVYVIVIYNYIPYRLRKSYREIGNLIEEISHGNYNIDIDSTLYDQDSDVQDLVLSIQKMLNILLGFDQAKTDKIFEHHQRIQQLINLLPQSAIVATVNGDLVYINDALRRLYPTVSDMMNLNELIFKNEFDQKLFNSLGEALRFGNNLYDIRLSGENFKQSVLINGSIVRNRKGAAIGAVFILNFAGDVR
jgi:predicted PurR-regulated permease PerM